MNRALACILLLFLALLLLLLMGSPQRSRYAYIFQCYLLNLGVDASPENAADDRRLLPGEHYSGTWCDWHKNGVLREKCEYVDGIRIGIVEQFYDNSLPECISVCKDGVIFANTKIWNYQGHLLLSRPLKNYLIDGSYDRYDSDGKLQYQSFYENGVLKTYPPRSGDIPPPNFSGDWLTYYPHSEQKHELSQYQDGKCMYQLRLWHKNGELIQKTIVPSNKKFVVTFVWTRDEYMRVYSYLIGSPEPIACLLWSAKTKKISGYGLDGEPLPRFDDNGVPNKTGAQYLIPDRN